MTRLFETEYETVSSKVERFKCDGCGHVHDDHEVFDIKQYTGGSLDCPDAHQCMKCSEHGNPISLREQIAAAKGVDLLSELGSKLSFVVALMFLMFPTIGVIGGGYIGYPNIVDMIIGAMQYGIGLTVVWMICSIIIVMLAEAWSVNIE